MKKDSLYKKGPLLDGSMKIKYDRFVISNRWKKDWWCRDGTWVVFGLYRFYFSPLEYEWRICLFGIDLRFWFKKIY